MPQPGAVLDLPGWGGGLNKTTHPSLLRNDELASALNVDLGPGGEIRLRRGYQPYLMDGTDQVGEGEAYVWVACPPTPNALPNNADPIIAVQADADIDVFPYDDGMGGNTFGDLTALGNYGPKLVTMNDKYYITSSSSSVTPYEIAITGGPAVTATVKTRWAASGDETNQFPSARTLLVAYERVFAGGVVAGTNQGASRLYFSDILSPLSWKAANFIDVGPDDSEGITALAFFADQIIVFKQRSMWGISGSDFTSTTNLSLYKIADVGAVNEQSIVQMPQGLLFTDPAQGMFLWDGSEITNVGTPVFEYIKNNWNQAEVRKINAWRHGDKYHLSIPWGSFSTPTMTFVWDGVLRAWTQHTHGFRAVARRFVTANSTSDPDSELTIAGNIERIIGVGAATYAEGTPTPPGDPIPEGVILMWPGEEGDIPANWTRITALDDKYPKGIPNSSTNPGTVGGSATHTHTLPEHRHALTHKHGLDRTSEQPHTATGDTLPFIPEPIVNVTAGFAGHDHALNDTGSTALWSGYGGGTVGSGPSGENMPHKRVIFVESDGVDEDVPAGLLGWHDDLTPATGWQRETSEDSDTRPSFLKGAETDGDGDMTRVAPAAHSHTASAHTHGGVTHSHTSGNTGQAAGHSATSGSNPVAAGGHIHSTSVADTSTGNLASGGSSNLGQGSNALDFEPPWRALNLVESVTGKQFVGLIGLWLDSLATIPAGWELCDGSNGRPNLLNRYPRALGALALGQTGGGLPHTHSGTQHNHTIGQHRHTVTFGTASASVSRGGAISEVEAHATHTHPAIFTDFTTPNVQNNSTGASSGTVMDPPHVQVAFIQLVAETDPVTNLSEGIMLLYQGSHDHTEPIKAEVATGFLSPESPLTLHRLRSVGLIIPNNEVGVNLHMHVDGGHDEGAAVAVSTPIEGNTTDRHIRTRGLNAARWRTAQIHWELTTEGLDPADEYDWHLSQATLEYSTLPSTRTD